MDDYQPSQPDAPNNVLSLKKFFSGFTERVSSAIRRVPDMIYAPDNFSVESTPQNTN
ncbi:hypothetical protein [Cysteiniphilum marinum]|uniref:hypothetical protein n=1 Tax=Cysteiniphilum marinum TaxID=2774191 RepID=UPI0019399A67|nr:hypothetical protein [Cysteiniphilum marinum]